MLSLFSEKNRRPHQKQFEVVHSKNCSLSKRIISVIEKTWSFHVYSNSTTSSSCAFLNLTTKLVFKNNIKKF
jgi:hypothetical protein